MIRSTLVAGIGFACTALLTLAGCVTPSVSMESPSGFATFSDTDVVRAISPEGVLVRARSVSNDPPQSMEFWAEALERQLTDSGYQLVERSRLSMDSQDGILLEWLAPVSEDDWIYLTAISVAGEQIAIVEAAGPADQYGAYRDAILQSLGTLRVESP